MTFSSFKTWAYTALGAATLSVGYNTPAFASLGLFEHGSGIQSQALGGVVYGAAFETTTIGMNPANLAAFAPRYDLGVDVMRPRATGYIKGNAAGPDSDHDTDRGTYLYVPQGGISWELRPGLRMGMTLQSAGIGPEYADSPYQRFGGAEESTLQFTSSALSAALSVALSPQQSLGVALNVGYQVLEIEGVEFLGALSQDPDKVSDNGKDGAFNVGFSLGWRAQYANGLTLGAGYKSKSWAQRHTRYAGLLADGGRLELPAIWGAGVAYQLTPSIQVAADYQRYEFEAESSFGNRLSALNQGKPLGSEQGPGFGYRDLNAYKLGVNWQALPQTSIKAGYIAANQMMSKSETLFGMLGPVPTTTHYTVGFSSNLGGYELSGMVAHAPCQTVRGKNSIPAAFGGGEVNVSYRMWAFGLTIGHPL